MDKELHKIFGRFPMAGPDSLIPILQEIQQTYGFIPESSLKPLGEHLQMASSKIFGVATFYDQFRFESNGRYHIRICAGTSCHMQGNMQLVRELERSLRLKPGQVTRDGMYSLELVQCMGSCGKGPILEVNGKYWESVTTEVLKDIIQELKTKPQAG